MKHAQKLAISAAGLSLVIPGLGQIVHRFFAVGAFWIVMEVLFWNSSRAWLVFMVHALSAISAYWAVQRKYAPAARRGR